MTLLRITMQHCIVYIYVYILYSAEDCTSLFFRKKKTFLQKRLLRANACFVSHEKDDLQWPPWRVARLDDAPVPRGCASTLCRTPHPPPPFPPSFLNLVFNEMLLFFFKTALPPTSYHLLRVVFIFDRSAWKSSAMRCVTSYFFQSHCTYGCNIDGKGIFVWEYTYVVFNS